MKEDLGPGKQTHTHTHLSGEFCPPGGTIGAVISLRERNHPVAAC